MEINTDQIKPWVWQALGLLLVAFLGISVLDKVYNFSQDFRNSVPKNTLSMSAEGKVSARPDVATVNVGVLTNEPTAKAAQDQNTKITNELIDFIKKQGLADDDIVTSNFSVYPKYEYNNGRNTINGYQANQTLTIKVHGVDKSTETLGKILSGAVDNGSNQIQGVNFSFDDPDDLKQEARKIAIEKAKQKASDLAQASGLRLGRVVTISENSIYSPYPMPYVLDATKDGMGGGGTAPAIEAGSQDIIAQMTIIFEVK